MASQGISLEPLAKALAVNRALREINSTSRRLVILTLLATAISLMALVAIREVARRHTQDKSPAPALSRTGQFDKAQKETLTKGGYESRTRVASDGATYGEGEVGLDIFVNAQIATGQGNPQVQGDGLWPTVAAFQLEKSGQVLSTLRLSKNSAYQFIGTLDRHAGLESILLVAHGHGLMSVVRVAVHGSGDIQIGGRENPIQMPEPSRMSLRVTAKTVNGTPIGDASLVTLPAVLPELHGVLRSTEASTVAREALNAITKESNADGQAILTVVTAKAVKLARDGQMVLDDRTVLARGAQMPATVWAACRGFVDSSITTEILDPQGEVQDIELVLERSLERRLRIRVVDTSEEAVSGASVYLEGRPIGQTGDDGAIFADINKGASRPARIGVVSSGRPPFISTLNSTEVDSGEVLIHLSEFSLIAGIVVDQNGMGVEGAVVRGIGQDSMYKTVSKTNARGEFRIEDASEGAWRVDVSPPGERANWGIPQEQIVQAPNGAVRLTLKRLGGGARLEVRWWDGHNGRRMYIQEACLKRLAGGEGGLSDEPDTPLSMTFPIRAMQVKDGEAWSESIYEGRWRIWAAVEGYGVVYDDFSVDATDTLVVRSERPALPGSIIGKVDSVSNVHIPSSRIVIAPVDASWTLPSSISRAGTALHGSVPINEDGTFRFDRVIPCEVSVQLRAHGFRSIQRVRVQSELESWVSVKPIACGRLVFVSEVDEWDGELTIRGSFDGGQSWSVLVKAQAAESAAYVASVSVDPGRVMWEAELALRATDGVGGTKSIRGDLDCEIGVPSFADIGELLASPK